MKSRPRARDRGGNEGERHLELTGVAEASRAGSGMAWRGRTTAANVRDQRKKTMSMGRCRARELDSVGVYDVLYEAETMEFSGRLVVAGDDGELELELGSNGGRKERGQESEWVEGEGRNGLRRVFPSRPGRRGGQAGTQVRGLAGGSGGHLVVSTGDGRRHGGARGNTFLFSFLF